MSTNIEQETDSEREQTYKRGYAHGVAASISALASHLTKSKRKEIDDWYRDALVPWMENADTMVRAPEFPEI